MSLYGIPPTQYPSGLTHDQLIRDITAVVNMENPMTTHPFMNQMVTRLGDYAGPQMQTHINLLNSQQVIMKQIEDTEEAKPRTYASETRIALQVRNREFAIQMDDLDKMVLSQGAKAAVEAAKYLIGSQGMAQTQLQKVVHALLSKVLIGTGASGLANVTPWYMHQYVNPATRMRHYVDVGWDGTTNGATKLGLTKEKMDRARMILSRTDGINGAWDNPSDYVLLIPQSQSEVLRKIPEFSEQEFIGSNGNMPYSSGMFVSPYGFQVLPCDLLPGTRGFNGDFWKNENPALGHADMCQWIDLEANVKRTPGSPIIPADEQWAIMVKKSSVVANGSISNIIGEHVGRNGGFYVKVFNDPYIDRKPIMENKQTTFFLQNTLTRLHERQVCVISLKKHNIDTEMFAAYDEAV